VPTKARSSMAHVTNDQFLEENPDLASRAGVTYIGKYRSSRATAKRALANLGKGVEVPAVDRGIERRLKGAFAELDYGKDNRSVTAPQWVEEGIARFGCPLHTATSGRTTSFTVPGYGICSCRRGERPDSKVHSPLRTDIGGQWQSASEGDVLRQGAEPQRSSGDMPLPRYSGVAQPYHGTRSSAQVHDGFIGTLAYKNAVSAALSIAGGQERRRKPYSLARVVEAEIHRDKFSGAPFFDRNDRVLEQGLRLAERIREGHRGFDPYVCGRRVQSGAYGPKTRLVWMAPLPTTIVGSSFSKPVLAGLARRRPFSFGLHQVEKAAIVEEFKSRFKYVYSLDFSKFDSSMPARIIDDAFGIAKTHLELDAVDENLWDRYKSDFIHSRIITPSSDIYQVHKGIPSGSAFTTIIGSLCNLICIQYILIRTQGRGVADDRVQIQGDDALIGLNTYVPLNELAAVAAELGLTLSVEKTYVTTSSDEASPPVHYLGYSWEHARPHKPIKDVVANLVFPERHAERTDAMSLLRLISSVQNSVENFHVFRHVFGGSDVIQSFLACSSEMCRSGDLPALAAYDLSGQTRYRLVVDEDPSANPDPSKVLRIGIGSCWN